MEWLPLLDVLLAQGFRVKGGLKAFSLIFYNSECTIAYASIRTFE